MTDGEKVALDFVNQGVFRIDEEGKIWRMLERRGSRGYTPWRPVIPPKRLDTDNGHGYLQINLTAGGKHWRIQASRLVYLVANGTIIDDQDVDHFNFIRSDNRPSNLQQLSHLDNSRRSKNAGRLNQAAYAMYSDDKIREIRRRGKLERHVQLAVEFGCGRRHIDKICNREQYAWVGD